MTFDTTSARSERKSEEPQEMRQRSRPSPESADSDRGLRRVSSDPIRAPLIMPCVRIRPQPPSPFTDFVLVPEGWNPDDHDIQTDNIETNIKRSHERIEDGIMPDSWVQKLKIYEYEKGQSETTIRSMPATLDWNVIAQTKNLDHIQCFFPRIPSAGSGNRSGSAGSQNSAHSPASQTGSGQEVPTVKVVPPEQQSRPGSPSSSSSHTTVFGQTWSRPGTPWSGSTPRGSTSSGSSLGTPIGAPVFGIGNLASISEEPLNAPDQAGGDNYVQMTTPPNASPPTGPTILGGQPLKTPVLAPTSGAGDVGEDEEMSDAPQG